MPRIILLVIFCLSVFAQPAFETLPKLPTHWMAMSTIYTPTGGVKVVLKSREGNDFIFGLSEDKKSWKAEGGGSLFQIMDIEPPYESTGSFELTRTIFTSPRLRAGNTAYTSGPFNGVTLAGEIGVIVSNKIENGVAKILCSDRSQSTDHRGPFPSNDGKLYFSEADRGGKKSSIVSLLSSDGTGNCTFQQERSLDPRYTVLQAWRESDGSFLLEKVQTGANVKSSFLTRLSKDGTEKVLVSSDPATTIYWGRYVNMIYSPDDEYGIVVYLNDHVSPIVYEILTVKAGSRPELLTTLSGPTRVSDVRKDSVMLVELVPQPSGYLPEYNRVWVTKKGVKTLVTGPALPFGPFTKIYPNGSLDEDGNPYFVWNENSTRDPSENKLLHVFLNTVTPPPPPPTPLPLPLLETPASVEVSGLVALVGKDLVVANATTTVIVNGADVPTTVANGSVNFTAPATAGEYTLSVRIKNSTESVESNKVTLVVKTPPVAETPIYIWYTLKDGPYLTLYDSETWELITESYPVIPGRRVMGFIDYRKGKTLTMTVNEKPMTASYETINENTEKFFVNMNTSPGYASILQVWDGDKLVGEYWFNTLPPPQ